MLFFCGLFFVILFACIRYLRLERSRSWHRRDNQCIQSSVDIRKPRFLAALGRRCLVQTFGVTSSLEVKTVAVVHSVCAAAIVSRARTCSFSRFRTGECSGLCGKEPSGPIVCFAGEVSCNVLLRSCNQGDRFTMIRTLSILERAWCDMQNICF